MQNNIIFLLNIKNPNKPERSEGYRYSIDSWRKWANIHGHKVYTLDEPVFHLNEMSPIIMRHYAFDLLDHMGIEYDQICLVDADTIVHPECPDFFKLTDHKFCAVHNDGDYDWVARSVENYEYEFYGNDLCLPPDLWNYVNTGFMVTNKNYRKVHTDLLDLYFANKDKIQKMQRTYGVGTDQPLLNMYFRHNPTDIKILPYLFNMQDMERKNILYNHKFLNFKGIYHFNAMRGGENEVNGWLEKTFKLLYKC